jgi:DNA-binding response OmpR family regulator
VGPAVPLKGKRVLIVEDEYLIAAFLENEVVAMGGEAVRTASLDAALDVIATMHLDGAMVDITLSGQPTFLVADALAARHIPFVFETATERHGAPARHADVPWLGKPFKPDAVGRALVDLMRRTETKGPPHCAGGNA